MLFRGLDPAWRFDPSLSREPLSVSIKVEKREHETGDQEWQPKERQASALPLTLAIRITHDLLGSPIDGGEDVVE